MLDTLEFQIQLNKAIAQRYGMTWEYCEMGYSVEQLYVLAGKEDRVATLSFREGSPSEHLWGDSITCVFVYTERERIRLEENIQAGRMNYGKVKANYLLFDLEQEQIKSLKEVGFDSQDVVDLLVAPLIHKENTYHGGEPRKMNQLLIPWEPQSPVDEIKFDFWALCYSMEHGMLLTPSEFIDYLSLKLVLGIKLSEYESEIVFDEDGMLHNNAVSLRYLYFKSRLGVLSDDKKKDQAKLELIRILDRLSFLDNQLKAMGSSLEKLRQRDVVLFEQIVKKALEFKEVRLNSFGHYPIYLTYESFIHMGLRHISEWRFNDFYNRKAVFQLNEKDIIPTLRRVIDEINEEYQGIKAERPDYLFRRFGKNSIYLNGDYYMIHIASDGSVENFAKTIDKSRD